jgi:hypothetical protein
VNRAAALLVTFACVSLGLGVSGCRGTEDYLGDLQDVYDRSGRRLRPEVYDAGQLVHEAFSGLSSERALTLSQMARAVAAAGSIVAMDREVVPLLQSQAAAMLGWLAVRYPIPPVSEPWQISGAEASEAVAEQIAILGEQQERLGVPANIALLNSPDHAVRDRAAERLEAATGRSYGRNSTAWENWWATHGPAWRREAAMVSAGPMEIIGGARFSDPRQGLTQAAAVLNFLGLHAAIFDMPDLRAVQERTILHVARQVVVLGIDRAIRMGDSGVRGLGAQAAAQVLDPTFGAALEYALPRERDSVARARLIEALAHYPGKKTIELLMTQLRDDDRTVTTHAHRALVAIAGEDLGPEAPAWQLWWDQTGKARWP